jgi:uncharacterized protein (TIGR02284 family)
LLSGELAAVETYRQAIERVEDQTIRDQLRQNELSHEDRVAKLRNRIQEVGGIPAEGSGLWGSFAKFVEGGAAALGDKAALSMLEEGEDRGLQEYQNALRSVDPISGKLIEQDLLPEQERTHHVLNFMKETMV